MPISEAHSDAARRNGAQSNGPATPEGRARSAQNSTKHNFFGSTRLLSGEDAASFQDLTEEILGEFQPRNFIESRLIREMIDAEWRLQRVRDHAALIQEARMRAINPNPTPETAAQAFHRLAGESQTLQLLLRYENQFRRQFDKSYEHLMETRRHEQTDRETIRRRAEEEQLRILKEYIEGPTPGDLYGLYPEDAGPDQPDELEEDVAEQAAEPPAAPSAAPKSNPVNFPNEPRIPGRRFAADAARTSAFPKTGS